MRADLGNSIHSAAQPRNGLKRSSMNHLQVTSEGVEKRGATLHAISYHDEAGIVKALEGVDVLISAVAGEALVSAQVRPILSSNSTIHLNGLCRFL